MSTNERTREYVHICHVARAALAAQHCSGTGVASVPALCAGCRIALADGRRLYPPRRDLIDMTVVCRHRASGPTHPDPIRRICLIPAHFLSKSLQRRYTDIQRSTLTKRVTDRTPATHLDKGQAILFLTFLQMKIPTAFIAIIISSRPCHHHVPRQSVPSFAPS